MNSENLWRTLRDELKAGQPVLMALVAESHGSSPGKPGFTMLYSGSGLLHGSIGGGSIEHEFINIMKASVHKDDVPVSLSRRIHSEGEGPEFTGMACRGTQEIILRRFSAEDMDTADSILSLYSGFRSADLSLYQDGRIDLDTEVVEIQDPVLLKDGDRWIYRQSVGITEPVYIIGGGHVGLALSRQLHTLGYTCIVMDNRPGLKMLEENIYAADRQTLDYKTIGGIIPAEGRGRIIIIMTHDHSGDELVLEQLINHEYSYLGLMGSKGKVAQVRRNLMQKGISPEKLDKMHAPIGLPIGSRTPAEIAVSIAAELISLKYGK